MPTEDPPRPAPDDSSWLHSAEQRRQRPYATPEPKPAPSPWLGVVMIALLCATAVAVVWILLR